MPTGLLRQRLIAHLAKKASGFELRQYQEDAVQAILKAWREFMRILLVVPTAGGKTIIFAALAELLLGLGHRVLILAHRDELIDQAIDKLYRARRLVAVKEKAQDRAPLDAGVVVASVQTLCRPNRLEHFGHDHFGFIIVDEAHHTLAPSYQKILGHFPDAQVLGVTATPDRGDARNLGQYFQDIAFEVSLVDLVKAGWLCRIKVQTVPVTIDISGVSTRAGDFSEEELAAALEPVLEEVAGAIAAHAKGRKTLVFVPLVRIARQFAEILCEHGFAAEMISGACTDRAEKLGRFRRGETEILCNAMLLTEGYDEPSIDCVICLRPTKIRSLYAQMVGRGTRIHPGKGNLLILDFLWISRKQSLVKPAQLIAHDEHEEAAIESVLEEANGDLVEAQSTSRDRALARQILAQRKLKGEVHDLMDIIDLCIAYQAPELENYAPTMHWHLRELSEKQTEFLRRNRVDLKAVKDRGHASAIIEAMVKHSESIPATPKQISYLHHLGYGGDSGKLSKSAASRLIGQLIGQLKEREKA
jgi:superfamily II DNA or RNA helicase